MIGLMTASQEDGMSSIRIEKRGAADWVTLTKPEKLNALDDDMRQTLTDYFADRATDRSTRVIVLRGEGRGFCAGLDELAVYADGLMG